MYVLRLRHAKRGITRKTLGETENEMNEVFGISPISARIVARGVRRFSWLVAVFSVCLQLLTAQANGGGDLLGYLDRLSATPEPDRADPGSSLLSIADGLKSADPESIRGALPSLVLALQSKSGAVRSKALFLVFAIELRRDGSALLAPILPSILSRLQDEEPRAQILASQVVMGWRPEPPADAVPILVKALSGATAKTANGPDIVFTLSALAPANADAVDAIAKYMASDGLPGQQRIAAVNALGAHRVVNQKLLDSVVDSCRVLVGADQAYCIRKLGQMGPQATLRGEPLLRSIAGSEQAGPEARAAAQEVLQALDHGPK
jgi:hypothetical protein